MTVTENDKELFGEFFVRFVTISIENQAKRATESAVMVHRNSCFVCCFERNRKESKRNQKRGTEEEEWRGIEEENQKEMNQIEARIKSREASQNWQKYGLQSLDAR